MTSEMLNIQMQVDFSLGTQLRTEVLWVRNSIIGVFEVGGYRGEESGQWKAEGLRRWRGWVRGNKPEGRYSSQEMVGGFLNSESNIKFQVFVLFTYNFVLYCHLCPHTPRFSKSL